ncbi:preprotein translocase subunit YajC [Mucilaginibacter arboris]|uniref:Sec translocon accessory complex subunit YajC n=1 Tax=Mucilaginibacter arboris TaxID=2682090 RepID=A0A7K1SZN9_9SPHI|nr:preprotein translocase subunit YajC [Mucilaginibacter arboris]MVN22728.1 preprotein translocase subunit YajC [Mucilaginibacter arboris]
MISTILLQVSGGGLGAYGQFLPLVLIIIVFYFFMIRPQVKKQKDQKKYVDELKKGDKVVTSAGIHGKIVEVGDVTILIEVDNNVKIRFDKSAVSLEASRLLNQPAAKV